MELALTPEQHALQQELREYFAKIVTPEIEEEMATGEMCGPRSKEAIRQMGRDGWLGIGWPKAYGGQDRTAIEQFIFYDESFRAGAPVPMLSINSVAPTIMQFGSEEMKKDLLPKILAGEIQFAIGYTEPSSGTNLASLRTKAVRDGDEWVINGQKVFTSIAEIADYVWLACRTDPDALKLINWKVAWGVDHGQVNAADASATKVFGTEYFCQAYRLLLEILGPPGSLKRGSPGAILRGGLERAYQGTLILTFGGGTNEVQRDLIAVFGLKMPRSL